MTGSQVRILFAAPACCCERPISEIVRRVVVPENTLGTQRRRNPTALNPADFVTCGLRLCKSIAGEENRLGCFRAHSQGTTATCTGSAAEVPGVTLQTTLTRISDYRLMAPGVGQRIKHIKVWPVVLFSFAHGCNYGCDEKRRCSECHRG